MDVLRLVSLAAVLLLLPVTAFANELDNPTIHFEIENPADLDQAAAEKIYQGLIGMMAEAYAQSGDPTAGAYTKWTRFNTAPYLSKGHGNRFLNNYGNAAADGYLDIDIDDKMPAGAILAKDTFTATAEGDTLPGALFIMEKLEEGAAPETGDWRYVTIMPDGSVFGDSIGDDASRMTFCHDCHEQAAETDFLFLLPEGYEAK